MKKQLSLITVILISLLIPVISNTTPLDEQQPIHLVQALKDFKQTNNYTLLEQHKAWIKNYYSSAMYENEVSTTCTKALHYFAALPITDKSLVIIDIDDTAIFTVPTGAECDFIWPATAGTLWLSMRPAIQGVRRLYDFLYEQGFKIIFLSARPAAMYDHTIQEITHAGYHSFEACILMPAHINPDQNTALWKLEVRKQLAENYFIVGCIGDRPTDFEGGYTGYQVRLPNYIY